jgi:phosphatidylglycerol---prolipoprotein diacylglyceryl transferase
MTIDETRFAWVYPAAVVGGLVLLLAVPTTQSIPRAYRLKYLVLQVLTLVGAIVGAKLALLAGDLGWPVHPLPGGWRTVVESGRSIAGGLIGGFLLAETGKPLLRYDLPPNDRFAAKLPFSIALGRVGCVLGGCCRGVPWEGGPLAARYSDGIARFPAQIVELLFQLVVGIVLVLLVRAKKLGGGLFALYLILYGVFRFLIEPLRDTPKPWSGFSVYQGMALVMIALGAASLYLRVFARGGARAWHADGSQQTQPGRSATRRSSS